MNFFDTPVTPEAIYEVERCLRSGMISEGRRVREFEQELERRGYRNSVAVNSGTSALHLALTLAGVGKGDDVILPPQTFVATGLAILYCGARPVFADIEMDGNIDVKSVVENRTDKTKAVIAVSWGGNPCNLKELENVCGLYGWKLIQDNAQAFGATYDNHPLSDFGDYSCYSFQAIKAISTGDGGAVTCPDSEYARARKLRWFGIDREKDLVDDTGERNYNLSEIGFKYHMSDYSAALGIGNLCRFEERLERVRKIAEQYFSELPNNSIVKHGGSSEWLYDFLVERRTDFMRAMKGRGVPTSAVHVGIDRNDIFGGKKDLPVQRFWDDHHVCLPIHSSLTDEDVEQIIDAVKEGW